MPEWFRVFANYWKVLPPVVHLLDGHLLDGACEAADVAKKVLNQVQQRLQLSDTLPKCIVSNSLCIR